MYVDSHCHLNQLKLKHQVSLEDVLREANKLDVHGFLSVATDLSSSKNIQQHSENFHNVWTTAGIHPLHHEVAENWHAELALLAQFAQCVAIGETGLDYFYDKDEVTRMWQREALNYHIQLANQLRKPLIIHTRDAQNDTYNILKDNVKYQKPGVIHCITEDYHFASKFLDLGFYISFSGIVTFKNAQQLRAVVKKIPLDRILIETDSPYLTPEPHRKQSNLPQFVVEVAACIATIKRQPVIDIARQTTENFEKLFSVKVS